MENLNQLPLDYLYAIHEYTGIEFIIDDGQIIGAYAPEERLKL